MELRKELPEPIPAGIAALPRDRGYPVPWFVAWIGGKPDFRVIKPGAITNAIEQSLCWVCGRTIIGRRAYVVGPMCAVNRVSAEPPSHVKCADWSARACPFLVRPHARRREAGLPEESHEAAGIMLKRNPGVALLWMVTMTQAFHAPGGVLFDLGSPIETRWYAEGRRATREEVMASIDSGYPLLHEQAALDGDDAIAELERMRERAMRLVPA